MDRFETLLVTTDFSEEALPGVKTGADLAGRLGSRVILFYAVEDRLPPVVVPSSEAGRQELLEEHCRRAEESLDAYAAEHLPGMAVETEVAVGMPHEAIVAAAAEHRADLIVMATHGYGFVGRSVFGSTADRVLRHAPCPVMVVRSRE